MKNYGVFLLLFLGLNAAVIAQPPAGWNGQRSDMSSGGMAGKVVNEADETPFEYANVVVSDAEGRMLKGLVTDAEGQFRVANLPFGQPMRLEISFIGFITYKADSIILSAEQPFFRVGKVSLATDEALLKEVVVTGERSVVQTSLDKKTYNVEKSSITKSKSVSDVLNELPSVSVETDGTITLRGNSNVRILVDGESALAQSGEIELILQQLPAESVEKIDVVTNPSAKYDPEGTAGIINIILKKEKQRGVNGTVSAGLGSINKYNASTFISYRKNKLGLTANYNFRYYDSFGDEVLQRTTTTDMRQVFLNQFSDEQYDNMSHFARLGFNISPNKQNTISFGGLTSIFFFSRDSRLTSKEENSDGDILSQSTRDIIFNGNGVFSNANFSHTYNFKKENTSMKYGLNFSNFRGNFDGGYRADTTSNGESYFVSEQETMVDAISYSLDGDWDFTLPINENMSEEVGYSSSINWRLGDFFSETQRDEEGPHLVDLDLLNDYRYTDQIHAVYFNHIHSINRFSYQFGLRLEQVITDAESITAGERVDFGRKYFSYYPSLYLRQSFGKNEQSLHEMQLSYSRRVNRPSFRITNPYRDFSDPLNPRQGNPFLQPEYINSFELGYNKVWEKVTFNTSLFYKLTTDLFTRVSTLIDPEENIILTSYANLGTEHEFGWEVVSKYKLLDWWDLAMDFNISQNYINGTGSLSALSNESLSYGGKATSTMSVWKGLEIQVIGRYRGPRVTAQGQRDGFGTLDLSLKQDILKKKGSITFTANDLANTSKRKGTSSGEGFVQYEEDSRETRVFWLTFSYGFGKMGEMFNKRNNRGNNNDDGGDEGGVF